MARVKVSYDRGAILRLTSDVSNDCAYRAARKVQARARRNAPVATGKLRLSIDITRTAVGQKTTYNVGSPLDYAGYQEHGTGPIYAKKGGVLAFTPKGSGTMIFRPRTKGVPATHFMRKAAETIRLSDFT